MDKKQNSGICREAAEASILKESGNEHVKRLLDEIEREERLKNEQLNLQTEVITDFAALPENLVFSELAHYKLFNRDTKAEFFINGKVLEGKIGMNFSLYEQVKKRSVKAFAIGNQIVAFYRACCDSLGGVT